MKPLITLIVFCLWVFPAAYAQPAAWDESTTLYVTKYQLAIEGSPVYGLFDLGSKPSVRIIFPELKGGKLRLLLHGRHYTAPDPKPFSLALSFEDVTGRIFQQSGPFMFMPGTESLTPQWFRGLEEVAGIYGNQIIQVQVPVGTSVINLLGDDNTIAPSPYRLMGYISHIRLD